MRYLGVDFGLKKVGLASSGGTLAAPLKTIEVKGFRDAVEKVEKLVTAEGFDKVIVGLPEGKIGQTVLGFVNALQKLGIDAETCDETLSSKRAKQLMIELGVSVKKRRFEDDIAAAQILQDYLDSP